MQIVSSCLARDLPVYRVTFESLREHASDAEIHVVTRRDDFAKFRSACGSELHLWDESELLPGMTLPDLRELSLPFFPQGAGWYFQQFLKFGFERVSNEDPFFLIWDADTVLLKPIRFLDDDGKPVYVRASEHHPPYFETFRQLFGEEANREYSFISQHQVIHKETLREMLGEIHARSPEQPGWEWAIMANLRGEGSNLFSEYETYGHYLKLRHPDEMVAIDRPWTREGGGRWRLPPTRGRLKALARDYDFAAFEASDTWIRTIARRLKRLG